MMTPLDATLQELRDAGYRPVVTRCKHWRVKCDGLPPISVSATASDRNAVKVAVRLVRKIIAENRVDALRR